MEMSNAMLAAGMLFSVSLILASLVRVYRVDHIWMMYQAGDGSMHTGSFTFSHHTSNDWMIMDVVKDVVCQDKLATIVVLEIRGYGYRVRRAD